MIVLETALPAKFAETIRRGDRHASRRGRRALRGIEELPRRFEVMPADAERRQALIAENAEAEHLATVADDRRPQSEPRDAEPGRSRRAAARRRAAACGRRARRRSRPSTRCGRVLAAGRALARSTCRRRTTARWTATRCACADVRARRHRAAGGQRIAGGQRRPAARSRARAARIFTGAQVPRRRRRGGDAGAVRSASTARVRVAAVARAGQWIRRRGEDVRRDAVVLRARRPV